MIQVQDSPVQQSGPLVSAVAGVHLGPSSVSAITVSWFGTATLPLIDVATGTIDSLVGPAQTTDQRRLVRKLDYIYTGDP